jgi:hypothetical protein
MEISKLRARHNDDRIERGHNLGDPMRQVEISRTIVFDPPRHARGFF